MPSVAMPMVLLLGCSFCEKCTACCRFEGQSRFLQSALIENTPHLHTYILGLLSSCSLSSAGVGANRGTRSGIGRYRAVVISGAWCSAATNAAIQR